MRRIMDFVARHHEPIERWEFNLFAAAGVGVFVITLLAAAYVRVVEPKEAEVHPAPWDEKSDGIRSRPEGVGRVPLRRADHGSSDTLHAASPLRSIHIDGWSISGTFRI